MHDALKARDIEIIALAGFMRVLSPWFCQQWQGRMINIHPSLLPSLKGLDTHKRALEAGVKEHGCTVHFVTPDLDDGAIILQAKVPVLPTDDEESLASRVLAQEHILYPQALAKIATALI
jgi:phosphoribosylglycinamide formyltransferase 1